MAKHYHTIVLPTRSQPDTIVAIFILKRFGKERFPGIEAAKVEFWQMIPEGESETTLDEKGVVAIDIGKGKFDHHDAPEKITASELVAEHLNMRHDPALQKLIEYARRDDFYGKGIISNDPIDRAFGLSALIANLNRLYMKEPERVVDIVLPLIEAHYEEELKRTSALPKELGELRSQGLVETFDVKQRDKNLHVIILTSDNGSFAGYLRSQLGGRFDVVAQWLHSGHLNILTRPTKRVDLRSLAALLRIEEAGAGNMDLEATVDELSRPGRADKIPEWYFDLATNSLLNGGLNPKEVPPTKIAKSNLAHILELGLSEKIWNEVAPESAA